MKLARKLLQSETTSLGAPSPESADRCSLSVELNAVGSSNIRIKKLSGLQEM